MSIFQSICYLISFKLILKILSTIFRTSLIRKESLFLKKSSRIAFTIKFDLCFISSPSLELNLYIYYKTYSYCLICFICESTIKHFAIDLILTMCFKLGFIQPSIALSISCIFTLRNFAIKIFYFLI